MATSPGSPEPPREEEPDPSAGEQDDDRPELLIKLQERKRRHSERGVLARALVVVAGVLLVAAGAVMAIGPGPGPLVILIGLSFLALEFDRAERWLGKAIILADKAKHRAENAKPWQKALAGSLAALALAAFVTAAVLYDIPLVPFI